MCGQHGRGGERERGGSLIQTSRAKGVHFVCLSELMKSLRWGKCICGEGGRETQRDGKREDAGIERTAGREERWGKKGY